VGGMIGLVALVVLREGRAGANESGASGELTPVVVELFTAEGSPSCPAARQRIPAPPRDRSDAGNKG
jgi:hypothetical protein